MQKECIVLLANGFEEIEAITPIDLLRRADITVVTVGIGGKRITGGHNIVVIADTTIDEWCGTSDAVILPGGGVGTTNLSNSEIVIKLTTDFFHSGKLCAAICAAPLVFEKAGILAGKRFTCYPGVEKKISSGIYQEADVICDDTMVTSRSAATALPFGLKIIELMRSREHRQKIALSIAYPARELNS
ncbi:MAG: DJ-1/PfpI family protein [Chitinivibrionales bacterium]|nr:DJ-1/PfpI family protein [Chitinivibrionales bacterium]